MEDIYLATVFSVSSLLMYISLLSIIYTGNTLKKEPGYMLRENRLIINSRLMGFFSTSMFMLTAMLSLFRMIELIHFPDSVIALFFTYGMLFQFFVVITISRLRFTHGIYFRGREIYDPGQIEEIIREDIKKKINDNIKERKK